MHTYHVSQICYALFQSCFVIRKCEPSALPFQTTPVISGEGEEKNITTGHLGFLSHSSIFHTAAILQMFCVSLSFLNGSLETQ